MAVPKNNYILATITLIVIIIVLASAYYSNLALDFLLVAIGVSAAAFTSYILYRSFMTEKGLVLGEGEKLLLEASDGGSYIVVRRLEGKPQPNTTISANLYLTNVGVACEDRSSKQTILFIPVDMIAKADLEGKGIKIDFYDHAGSLAQVVLHVGEKSFHKWTMQIYDMLKERAPPTA
ncbi:MAG TPA: hypothetical protein ENN13_00175 [Candidatus Altiarchaeales archaeon]|nr:hypothetical protein [Candidatus Altiarchaeales archaeon]